ncbi:MAG: gamma-glutamyltransferase [Bacteroidota bacterium]
MRILLITLLFALVLFACKQNNTLTPSDYNIKKSLVAENGMVVSAHPLASEVGGDILKQGGNAIDAAIAVQLALAVVYPGAGNIGGGGFMVLRSKDGEVRTLDYREKAPSQAHRDMYLDSLGNADAKLSTLGHLAAGVPGTVDGLFEAHKEYGKLDFESLIQPAIDLARNGFKVTQIGADRLNSKREDFLGVRSYDHAFLDHSPWEDGHLLIQKELAMTLERIRDHGRDGFYKGKTADMIVEEMKFGGGIISHADLENYKAQWRQPIEINYDEYTLYSMPPPSSGGIALFQMLEMIEPFDLHDMEFHSPESVHIIAEAQRRAFADRAVHLGDSDFYNVPIDLITSPNYLASKMADFSTDSATVSTSIEAAKLIPVESNETTHLSVVDLEGNAVAVTTTLNSTFGCKVVVKGAGFVLNNEMDDFSAKPGVPNQFGLIGGEANSIAPGKRMLSSMTPTVVTKDDELFLVVGTPGGSRIITTVFNVFVNIAEYDLSVYDAVQAKRLHHQWLPDQLTLEEGKWDAATVQALETLGHKIKWRLPKDFCRVNAIMVNPDGKLEGAGDERSDETVVGH